MVGVVVVSHSARLADGVVELAGEMGGPDVAIEPAGGIESPEPALGTDAVRVVDAVTRADSGDGVVVLMDLGSAVLSAEMALDLLPDDLRDRVVLCEAPLVEGAVAAAVTARLGASLEQVAAEARRGLAGKQAQLGVTAGADAHGTERRQGGEATARLAVENPLGLHARPAARFVQTAAAFDADVDVANLTTGGGPVNARSVNALATLGVRRGHEIELSARGPQAAEAVAALRALAADNFGDPTTPDDRPQPAIAAAVPVGDGLAGLPAAPGSAMGPARPFRTLAPEIPNRPTDDPEAEWAALHRALARAREGVERLRASVATSGGEHTAGIFDAHLLFLEDEALLAPTRRRIFDERRNAAAAWMASVEDVAREYRALDDEYLRARAEDVLDVGRRVALELVGAAPADLPGAGILVAADLAPADTAALDPGLVAGIATARGGPTSHTAILARSLGIPAVVALGDGLLAVPEGTRLLVDGDAGTVVVDPDDALVREYEQRRAERDEEGRRAKARAHEPAVTRDRRAIEVAANVGSADDATLAVEHGADAVGLLRTEFLFLGRDTFPDEREQVAAYSDIAARLGGRPVTLRTLDIGGDKPLAALPRPPEANPFLGVRGIRLTLAEPQLLETQLRAALRAAADYPLRVMFPMVATLDEYRRAREILERERERVDRAGPVDVGVMIEVPAAAIAADLFAPEVDFFSIGTNDLSQYAMAAERGNEDVAALADALHPGVVRLVGAVADAGAAHGKWVGVCGEIASDPLAVPLLLGLGITELSVNVHAIPAVKDAVRATDVAAAEVLAAEVIRLSSAAAVRAVLADARQAAAAEGVAP